MDARTDDQAPRVGTAQPPAADPQGPPGRPAGARRGARAARRAPAPARPPDRAPASDPGPLRPPLGRPPCRAGAGDEARAHRGVRGRDLLRPFRRGEGRRDAAARRHRAGVRLALLRDGGRRAPPARTCRTALGRDVRVVRAPCMGACDRAPVCAVRPCPGDAGDRRRASRRGRAQRARMRMPIRPRSDFDAYVRAGGYALLKACLAGTRTRDDIIKVGERRRAARPRRRRLPDRPQVVAGARRARAAADGGQCRRGRARHLQGPAIISNAIRTASSKGMLIAAWVVEAPDIYIYIRDEYPEVRLMLARRDRQGRSARGFASTPGCICVAAPAPISAAKSPR